MGTAASMSMSDETKDRVETKKALLSSKHAVEQLALVEKQRAEKEAVEAKMQEQLSLVEKQMEAIKAEADGAAAAQSATAEKSKDRQRKQFEQRRELKKKRAELRREAQTQKEALEVKQAAELEHVKHEQDKQLDEVTLQAFVQDLKGDDADAATMMILRERHAAQDAAYLKEFKKEQDKTLELKIEELKRNTRLAKVEIDKQKQIKLSQNRSEFDGTDEISEADRAKIENDCIAEKAEEDAKMARNIEELKRTQERQLSDKKAEFERNSAAKVAEEAARQKEAQSAFQANLKQDEEAVKAEIDREKEAIKAQVEADMDAQLEAAIDKEKVRRGAQNEALAAQKADLERLQAEKVAQQGAKEEMSDAKKLDAVTKAFEKEQAAILSMKDAKRDKKKAENARRLAKRQTMRRHKKGGAVDGVSDAQPEAQMVELPGAQDSVPNNEASDDVEDVDDDWVTLNEHEASALMTQVDAIVALKTRLQEALGSNTDVE